jgi:energy-coupling factor transporter ATP-binding protein EcfA2
MSNDQKNRFIKEKIEDHSLFPKSRRAELLAKLETGDFPAEAFPENVREWLTYYKEQFGYPEAATAMIMLTLLSASIGQQVRVVGASAHGSTPLNIWTVVVGPRGSGKSSLLRDLARPLVEADREARSLLSEMRIKIEAEMENIKASVPRNRGDVGSVASAWNDRNRKAHERASSLASMRGLNLLTGSASSEALKKSVAEALDNFTHVMSSEGSEIFSIMFGKYNDNGGSDLDSWLALKTGDYLNDVRIKRESVTIHCGYISMLLTIQDFVAKKLINNEEAITRGLFTRMYFIDPKFGRKKELQLKKEIDAPLQNILFEKMRVYMEKRIRSAMANAQNVLDGFPCDYKIQPESIECDPAAANLFLEFNNAGIDIENAFVFADQRLPGECSRWREDAIQIAGLLSVLLDKPQIDYNTAQAAIAIVLWCKKNFLRMLTKHHFTGMGEKFEHLEGLIENSANGQVSTYDLKNRNGFSSEDIEIICHLYGDEIEIVTVKSKSPKGGRPSTVIRFK